MLDEVTATLLDASLIACRRAKEVRLRCALLAESVRAEAKAASLEVLRSSRAAAEALGGAQAAARSGAMLATAKRRRLDLQRKRLSEGRASNRRTLVAVTDTLRRDGGGGSGGGGGGDGGGGGGGQQSANTALRLSASELHSVVGSLEAELLATQAEARRVKELESALISAGIRIGEALAMEEECLRLRQSRVPTAPPRGARASLHAALLKCSSSTGVGNSSGAKSPARKLPPHSNV
mmetsp:Transcript_29704/g.68129  ORF Transcript_29704/g.68129 Transcript_29704/m.68129 type:complete len:237 (-) Transcript_29704:180-890(-)